MSRQPIHNQLVFLLTVSLFLFEPLLHLSAQNLHLRVHVRGVSECSISLLALSGQKQFKRFAEAGPVINGQTAELIVPGEYLPGEFILRFDYREKTESSPYPSEKRILIGNQPIELWAHPMFANHPDSTWFQKDEKENAAFLSFSKENNRQKEKIGLLQQFLMEYDHPDSDFYRHGILEYESRRQFYNQWLDQKVQEDSPLYAASLYRFSYLPQVIFQGNEKDRLLSLIAHYFDGIDFNDPLIIKSSLINDWMNSYVNLHGKMATTEALRDSLISAAALSAIEKARHGNPVVYGWMVDYFYRGFEANNIPNGMKVLEPYLDDPNCLTTKKIEIERRLKGMETLVNGVKAPDFTLNGRDNKPFQLYEFSTQSSYILLLFWSADCSHCAETISALHPWSLLDEIQKSLTVVAISLDETDAEIKAWERKAKELSGWNHLRASEGINSKIANDYFILATPVMLLLNTKTKEIAAIPGSFDALKKYIAK